MKNDNTANLIDLRNRAATAYYTLGAEPIISDAEFDALLEELDSRGVEQVIGHGYVPTGDKVVHAYPMQSLKKAKTLDEITKWLEAMPHERTTIQFKYDGLGLSLIYRNGVLVQAATRGDHTKGDDITMGALTLANLNIIPGKIPALRNESIAHVRGEVIITHTDFAALNADTVANGREAYSSERNAASGLLRKSDAATMKYLTFIAYETDTDVENDVETLASWGFSNPGDHFYRHLDGADEMLDTLFELDAARKNADFETDGAVIKYDGSTLERDEIGRGTRAPKWALAYKYEDTPVSTIIRDVVWSQRRTRKLTPVAHFDAVTLTGNAVTTKASLANYAKFERLGLRPGDHILVIRANGVIPFVVGIDPTFDRPDVDRFHAPTEFPEHSGLVTSLSSTDKDLLAHPDAPVPVVAQIENALKVLDIKGIGPSLIETLVDQSNVEGFLDMLNLTAEDISVAMGYEKVMKSAVNAHTALQKSFNAPLWRWIAAIGMKLVATSKSPILEQRFPSLEALSQASLSDLMSLERFGDTNAQTVYDSSEIIADWARRLKEEHNFTPAPEAQEPLGDIEDSVFSGKKIIITGTFPTLSRNEVQDLVKKMGGKISSSVSSSTDLVIYGESAGSKLDKANSLNVATMTAEEFEKML